jgi:hypothetical protein
MSTLNEIQYEIKSKLLILQRINRLINSEQFINAYNKANDEQLTKLSKYLEDLNKDAITYWIKIVLKEEYEEYSVMDLRNLAKNLGIRHYQSLTKDSLLFEIYKAKGIN